LPGIFFKPYPCNHFTHAGIDAALQLREDGVAPADVAEIELGVPGPVLRTIAQPPEVKAAPPTGYAGAFSGPYTVAAALVGGGGLGVWMDDFTDEAVADPRRLELAAKVRCVSDARCDEIFPHQFPAVLRVRTVTGTMLEKRVHVNRGGPLRPLTDEELGVKFALGARRVLPEERVSRLKEAVLSLASAPSVRDVVALTW
jgi:2-methylcitrate dehydratase PrpD